MLYSRFIVYKYRAITEPLSIDIKKSSLIPIIGVNECGKTTILQAIFALDHYNDTLNQNGRHLGDVQNLYSTSSTPAEVGAEVEITVDEFKDVLSDILKENINEEELKKSIGSYKRRIRNDFTGRFIIKRNLSTKKYFLEQETLDNDNLNDLIVRKMLVSLPYILYFDDFRDSVEERIEIKKDKDGETTGWLSVMERLFEDTDSNYSVFKLKDMEERRRKSVIAKVKKKLNKTLTKEWQNFRLDERDALLISIEYEQETQENKGLREYLKLEVIETDTEGEEHYFFVRDRSKGFFWFFNFVMKLEFNPKTFDTQGQSAIYLLDEPGSYLHASAQAKLCNKLSQLSEENKVIYCTHSHYLLNPEVIPLSFIRIADKDGNGNIILTSIYNYRGNIIDKRSAFQPIMDALQIKPFLLDFSHDRVLITEGVYDFYALSMFRERQNFNILPSVGAGSVKFYISLMIAWRLDYRALWDNDKEGRSSYQEACKYFGPEESKKSFHILKPISPRSKKTILQNYFKGDDLKLIRNELNLPRNTSFEKTILTLYYSSKRAEVLSKVSRETKDRFSELLKEMHL